MSNVDTGLGLSPVATRPVRVALSPVVLAVTLPTAMPAHADIQAHCVAVLADLCGGAGAYVMRATGEVVTEPHTRVWAYTPAGADTAALDEAMSELGAYVLAHSSEECVSVEDCGGAWLAFRPAVAGGAA